MTEALRKRVLDIEGPEGLERRRIGLFGASNEKRFNRHGVPKNGKRSPKKGGKAGAAGKGGAAAAGGAAAGGAAAAAAGTGGAAAAGSGAAGGGNAPDTDGNSPQNYLILMDSGSADLWVASEQCQTSSATGAATGADCGNHQTLGPTSSSSFVATTTPFQVTYGTGAVAGNIINDDITVAGLTLKAHTFGVCTQETDDFSADTVPFDGLMGLAQSTLSQQQTPTPVESLASAGLITDAITSYKISRAADNLNDGEITFGALDATKFDASTLTTVPNVNTQGFWEAALDDVTVDGQTAGLQGRTAILDTGTTLIVAPVNDATAVHALITGSTTDGQGGFTVPCTFNQSVALVVGGTTFAIEPQDIAVSPVNANDPTGDCVSGISGGSFGTSDTEWLVGDVFLKNAYYSTDIGKNAISLAKLT
ncbi:aspartic peptidase domain-containing protein [Mycena galopus ATCC 62051]|nr:aspartic peptidase domain-containing protein [Mycena galopus ATCC 62051]